MGSISQTRRFKTNPVEIAIFAIVTILFGHSVYRLFNDSANYKPNALSAMTSRPLSEDRSPASASTQAVSLQSPLLSLDFRCQDMTNTETSAHKVRLTGTSCAPVAPKVENSDEDEGRAPASVTTAAAVLFEAGALPSETRIYNQSNRFAATVFQDSSTHKFTTDYIPLVAGPNSIHVQFVYKGGKTFSQDFVVSRQ